MSSSIAYLRDCFERCGRVSDHYQPSILMDMTSEDKGIVMASLHDTRIPYYVEGDNVIMKGTNAIDFIGLIGKSTEYEYRKVMSNDERFVSPVCQVFKTDVNGVIPFKTRESDVGYDLTLIKEHKKISTVCTMYDTGIKINVSNGFYGEIIPRSSIIKSGYMLANNTGVIDRSYSGNLYVALVKVDPDAKPIELPFRGFQLVFRPQVFVKMVSCSDTSSVCTSRGEGGFGSTGV